MIVQIFLGQRIFLPYKEYQMVYNMEDRYNVIMARDNIDFVKISYILKANLNILLNFGFKVSNQFMQVKYILGVALHVHIKNSDVLFSF